MRIPRILMLAAVFAAAFVPTAVAGGIQFQNPPDDVLATYDFAADQVIARSLSVTKGSGGNFEVGYIVGFTAGSSGNPENRRAVSAAGTTLPYRIVDSEAAGNDLKTVSDDPTENEVLFGTVARGETVTETFDVLLPGGDLPPPGSYTDNITVELFDTLVSSIIGGDPDLVETSPLDIEIVVPTLVDLSLVPVGGTFDPGSNAYLLDLGLLEDGTIGVLDMLVRANVAYSVTATSANDGTLAHIDPGDASRVGYTLRVDGSPADLASGPAVLATGTGPTPTTGARYELEVEVGDPEDATAGTYEDTLQVTVTAQ